jgi:MmyB-like transcription regulator ligand binding domain
MQDANSGVAVLTGGCAPDLLQPPVNVLRLSLHPDGMAPRAANLSQWRAHLLTQLQHRARALADTRLTELYEELAAIPAAGTRRCPLTAWYCRSAIAGAARSWRCSASARSWARPPT